MIVLKLFK